MLAKEIGSGKKGGDKGISIQDMIRKFLEHLEFERGLAKNTIYSYRADMNRLAEFCSKTNIFLWGLVDLEVVQRWIVSMGKEARSTATINRRIASVKQMNRCAQLKDLPYDDKINSIYRLRAPFRLHKTYGPEVFGKLIEAAKTMPQKYLKCRLDLRDLAIFEFLYSSACRASTITTLRLGDLDLEQGQARTIEKGDRERILYMCKPCVKAMEDYLKLSRPILVSPILPRQRTEIESFRKYHPVAGKDVVFLSRAGKVLSRVEVWRIVNRVAKAAGIKDLSVHSLRHHGAQGCFDSGLSLSDIQLYLGHASLQTTTIYASSSPERLKRLLKEHHPRANK